MSDKNNNGANDQRDKKPVTGLAKRPDRSTSLSPIEQYGEMVVAEIKERIKDSPTAAVLFAGSAIGVLASPFLATGAALTAGAFGLLSVAGKLGLDSLRKRRRLRTACKEYLSKYEKNKEKYGERIPVLKELIEDIDTIKTMKISEIEERLEDIKTGNLPD